MLVEDDLDRLFDGGCRIVADPRAPTTAGEIARVDSNNRLLLAVGPEGGWNAFELKLLGAHGFQSVGMGPRTLRTDTACIALVSLFGAVGAAEPLGPLDKDGSE